MSIADGPDTPSPDVTTPVKTKKQPPSSPLATSNVDSICSPVATLSPASIRITLFTPSFLASDVISGTSFLF